MIEFFNQKRSEHICFLLSNYHSSLGRAAKTIKGTNQVRRCLDKRDWLVSLARSCFISVVQVEGEPAGSEEIHPLSSLQWLRNKKKEKKKPQPQEQLVLQKLHFPSETLSESLSITPKVWILFVLKCSELCDRVCSPHSVSQLWKGCYESYTLGEVVVGSPVGPPVLATAGFAQN